MRRGKKKKFFSMKNIMAIFIVAIMVFSIGGIMIDQLGRDNYEYNGFKFISRNNQWILKHEGNEFAFDFFPTDVENIEMDSEVINKFDNVFEIDSTYDPNDAYVQTIAKAQYDMNEVLEKFSNAFIRIGMTDKNEYNATIIECNDSTDSVPVLYFKDSNQTKVSVDTCIIAEAKFEREILMIKDRVLYEILGVI